MLLPDWPALRMPPRGAGGAEYRTGGCEGALAAGAGRETGRCRLRLPLREGGPSGVYKIVYHVLFSEGCWWL